MKKMQGFIACLTILLVLGSIGYSGVIHIKPSTIKSSNSLTFTASNFKYASGSFTTKTRLNLNLLLQLVQKANPLAVVSVSPANSVQDVPVISNVVAAFSQPMDKAATQNAFSILPAASGTFSWSADSKTMTFDPAQNLAKDTIYSVTVSTAAKNAAGNALSSSYVWSFKTKPAVSSANSDTLASATWEDLPTPIVLWNTSDESVIRTLSGYANNTGSIAWSPDGTKIVGSLYKTVKIWDATTGAVIRTLSGHSDLVTSVAWSPDGSIIASGSKDGTVKIWTASTGALIKTIAAGAGIVESVAWSPDSSKIVAGYLDGRTRVWSASSGNSIMVLTPPNTLVYIMAVAWSPDGTKIAACGTDPYGRTSIENITIWNASTGNRILELPDLSFNNVVSIAWSPASTMIASGASSNSVKVWNTTSGALLKTLGTHGDWVHSVSWSPDGTKIASGASDNRIKIWNASVSSPVPPIRTLNSGKSVLSVAWKPA